MLENIQLWTILGVYGRVWKWRVCQKAKRSKRVKLQTPFHSHPSPFALAKNATKNISLYGETVSVTSKGCWRCCCVRFQRVQIIAYINWQGSQQGKRTNEEAENVTRENSEKYVRKTRAAEGWRGVCKTMARTKVLTRSTRDTPNIGCYLRRKVGAPVALSPKIRCTHTPPPPHPASMLSSLCTCIHTRVYACIRFRRQQTTFHCPPYFAPKKGWTRVSDMFENRWGLKWTNAWLWMLNGVDQPSFKYI